MENKQTYSKKLMFLLPLSFMLLLGSLLIYQYLPASYFANSPFRPGMDAVYAFISSPVLAVAALAVFCIALLKNKDTFTSLLGNKIYIALSAVFSAVFALGAVSSVVYLAFQWKLGFLAPFDGTAYQTLHDITLIGLMLIVAFFLVTTIIIKKKK